MENDFIVLKNNLIYQCRIQDEPLQDFVKISSKTVLEYANRHGHSYIFNRIMTLKESDPNNLKDRFYNILDLIYDPRYDSYDNILYLDTDIIITDDAADIFQLVLPHADIIGVSEPMSTNHEHFESWLDQCLRFDIIPQTTKYLNTGAVIFTKKGRLKAREEWDIPWTVWRDSRKGYVWILDQPYINGMIFKHNFNIIWLPPIWNYWVKKSQIKEKAYFYHFSNNCKKFMLDFPNNLKI